MYGGFRFGRNQSLTDQANVATISADTVEMLQAQVQGLRDQNEEKEHNIVELMARVSVLEGLITKTADVAAVHTDVILIKTKVDLIHDSLVV